MGFRPNVRYSSVITNLGLTSGLRLCLDAGDSNSYSSGQKWLDTSGNGYDFFLGTNSGSEASDPVFTGLAGGLSPNEYWACDSDALFTYDSVNEAWMNNLHKDGAQFTVLAWVYLTSLGVAGASPAIFGTLGNSSLNGVQYQLIGGTGVQRLQVGNGSAVQSLSAGSAIGLNGWHLVGLSISENAGASGGQFYLDGAVTGAAFDPSYTTPSAANASFTMQVAAEGASLRPLGLNGAARIAFIAIWEGTTLSASQIASIYNYAASLTAVTGTYAITRNAAPLSTKLSSAAGFYALTGNAAFQRYAVGALTGAYAITVQPALFSVRFPAAAVSYSVTGNPAISAAKLLSAAGAYAVSGNAAPFGTSILSVAGSCIVTGNDATFTRDFEAWIPRPFDSDSWTAGAIESEAWTAKTMQPETWVAEPKQAETWTQAIIPPDRWTTE